MFDNYTIKARFYPVIIVFFPIVILGVFYSFEFSDAVHLLSSVGLVGALTYLFSQLGRDSGKLKEPHLWKSWGGAPSIQILRINDLRVDAHTKNRYHQKLQMLCPVATAPTQSLELNDPVAADEVYKAWSRFLISQTRDTKKFSLLLKDNTSYGFRRNLWGLKRISIFLIILLVIGNYIFWLIKLRSMDMRLFPQSFFYSTIVLLLILLLWVFIIRPDWIKIPAFSYAERLCESVELL